MIKTLDVKGIDNKHPAKAVYADVSDIMTDLGYNVDLISTLSGNSEIHGRDVGMNLQMSENVDTMIREGNFPFTLEKNLDGYFGNSTGSANVTTLKYERDMNLREALETFDVTGQLEKSLEIVEAVRFPGDPKAETILAYALAQYAKGWLAEKVVLTGLDEISKGSVSQDEGGIDFYFEGDMSQLGSITRYNSKKKQMEASDIRQILYQWTENGEMVVADMGEILDANRQVAKDAGISATAIRRRTDNLVACEKAGRAFRYLWW